MNEITSLIKDKIESLRPKLQDTSRRNPLINNVLNAKSASFIRIVDEKPQSIYDDLNAGEGGTMQLVPLPPVDIDPPDENSTEFKNAFLNAQSTDEVYLKTLESIDFETDEKAIDKQEDADRDLKDRLREMLDMPPRPKSEQFSDLINHAKSHGINPSSTLPEPHVLADDDRFEDEDLQTLLLPKTFQSRMSRIFSKMKMYQEERGLDVVYLVLGYLKWTLPNTDKQDEFKSPILLLPVSLKKSKSSLGESYSVTKLSDPIFNPSLVHKLSVEAKLDLSSILELVESESVDVEGLFKSVSDLKPKNMHWNVLREASFGIYPFQGIELYYDLDTENCDFSEFPVVSELMVGKEHSSDGGIGFTESDVESSVGQKLVPHIVLDADSSQFISLLKVANNENVALEGPPGSGKSQTIVNAIANAIHSGKRVLFVAQKSTALEVVYSRLQALGLEQFVLPLMGGYGSTDEFYEAVSKRLSLTTTRSSRDLASLQQQFGLQRDKLASYIDVLTKPVHGTGMSVHQVLGLSIANASAINALPIDLKAVKVFPEKFTPSFLPSDLDNISTQIQDWHRRLSDTQIPPDSVWYGVKASQINTDKINEALVTAKAAFVELESAIYELEEQSEKLIKTYLDNDFESIQYEVEEAAVDESFKKVHLLVQKIGEDTAYNALSELIDVTEELDLFSHQFHLSEKHLSNLSNEVEHLKDLLEFSNQFQIQRVKDGIITKTKEILEKRVRALEHALNYEDLFNKLIGAEVSVQNLIALKEVANHADSLSPFREFLRVKGIPSATSDLRKARSAYRVTTQTFESSVLPEPVKIKKLKDTIQNGGIFAFLSTKVKKAKEQAKGMLSSLSNNSSKTEIITALDEALEVSKSWKRLEVSDYVESLDEKTDSLFAVLLTKLDEIQSVNTATGMHEVNTLKLIFNDSLKDAIEYIDSVKVADLSWESLKALEEESSKQLHYVLSKFDSILSGEAFLVQIHKEWVSEIPALIKAAEQAQELLFKRDKGFEQLGESFDNAAEISKLFGALKDYSSMSKASIELSFSEEGNNVLKLVSEHIKAIQTIHDCSLILMEAKNSSDAELKTLSINEEIELLEAHRSDQRGLNSLVTQRSIIKESRSLGFDRLVTKLFDHENLDSVYETATAAIVSSLKDQVEKDYGALLLEFDGTSLSSARAQLQKLDKKIIEISPLEVSANAIAHASPPEGVSYGKKSDYTDLALLNHELQKKRRTPPRKVLKRAQGALLELFPCWMMVPTAVAQHLPRASLFDLVIIDEASQMTPENSISALMRGKNALIAGDTNQLPPTNFFKGLSVDEDEDEDVTTTEESILELANMQFHPKHRLLWHYRSRHEDLIAFSNHYVYDSELVIFPSPNPTTKELGISLVQVNGTFQRGVNPAEAQVMLEAIVQFMKETPNRSLGVAVMNQSQMEQIETLVLREAESNKVVSDYLDRWSSEREGLEKFFVKNLENVQGDERDVIFVGTVYGRDPQGKFYQRFGPINGAAGKRRLNVLFSRAKEQIVTFSSIPMADFNPSITNEGATLLRRWLEFSATKKLGEVAHSHDRAGHTDSPFEDHVIEAVKSLGYEAVPQVGVSSYFIDIGVKHPSYPFGYICGIECDGASYHSSKSARDRDRLREEVLNRLGWSLHRIWSTDWFRDALGCRELLRQYLAERLELLTKDLPEFIEPEEVEEPTVDIPPQAEVEDVKIEKPTSQIDVPVIELGSKVSVRYLDGPRAGATANFWFQLKTNDPAYKLDGFTTVGADSPLGEAIEGAELNEICSYQHGSNEVRVQVLDIS